MRKGKWNQLKTTYGYKKQCSIENIKSNCVFGLNTDMFDAYYLAFLKFLSGGSNDALLTENSAMYTMQWVM